MINVYMLIIYRWQYNADIQFDNKCQRNSFRWRWYLNKTNDFICDRIRNISKVLGTRRLMNCFYDQLKNTQQ